MESTCRYELRSADTCSGEPFSWALLKRLQAMIGRLRQGQLCETGWLIIESPEVVTGFLILVQMSRLGCAIYIVVVGSSFEMNGVWTFVTNYCSVTYLVWAGFKLYVLLCKIICTSSNQ